MQKFQQEIRQITANLEQESCGFVLENGRILPLENVASDPKNHFEISSHDYLEYRHQVVAIYHTHYREDQPARLSYQDIFGSKACCLPYWLYHTSFDAWDYFDPHGLHPYPLEQKVAKDPKNIDFYIGWRWEYNRSDCFTLLRSYYKGMLRISIRDYVRDPDPNSFLSEHWDRYRKELHKEGFRAIAPNESPQKHDVILMRINGENPHHIGILVESDRFIHNFGGDHLSSVVKFNKYWREHTVSIWRHKELSK